MIRFFCDICGNEVSYRGAERLKVTDARLTVEILVFVDKKLGMNMVCANCIKPLVDRMDYTVLDVSSGKVKN